MTHCASCTDAQCFGCQTCARLREQIGKAFIQLRTQLTERTAALTALLEWVGDEEPCAPLVTLMAQADRALADLPAAPEKKPRPSVRGRVIIGSRRKEERCL